MENDYLSKDRKKTEYMEILLRYLAASVDKEKKQDLKEEVKKAINTGDKLMTTIAEEWVQEGIEKGIGTGMEKGYELVAENSIRRGMTDEDIQAITGLTLMKIAEIRNRIKTSQ